MLRKILIAEALKLLWDRVNRDPDDHDDDREEDGRRRSRDRTDRHDDTDGEGGPFDTLLDDALTVFRHTLVQAVSGTAGMAAPLAEGLRDRAREVKAEGTPALRDLKREARAARHEGRGALDNARDEARRAAYDQVRAARRVQRRAQKKVHKAHRHTSRRLKRQQRELRELEKRARRLGERPHRGGSGSLLYLGLLLGAAYALARHPHLRHQLLDAVGRVSPTARDRLHEAGRSARQVLGEIWIEEEAQTSGPGAQRKQG